MNQEPNFEHITLRKACQLLAHITGWKETHVMAVYRGLNENGLLLTKGIGVNAQEFNLFDIAKILIGICGTSNAKNAHKVVKMWENLEAENDIFAFTNEEEKTEFLRNYLYEYKRADLMRKQLDKVDFFIHGVSMYINNENVITNFIEKEKGLINEIYNTANKNNFFPPTGILDKNDSVIRIKPNFGSFGIHLFFLLENPTYWDDLKEIIFDRTNTEVSMVFENEIYKFVSKEKNSSQFCNLREYVSLPYELCKEIHDWKFGKMKTDKTEKLMNMVLEQK